MLEAMRRGTQTWVAKLLFGILVASFAVWGIGDVFRGWGQGSVATIGDTHISVEEFNREFQRELEDYSRQSQRKLTPEQGRALGLDKRVVSQLLGSAALEAEAADLGMALSDETLVTALQNDPNLKDANGQFSKDALFGRLRQLGLSEQAFMKLYRRDELRMQLLGSLIQGLAVPSAMIEAVHAYRDEKRAIEYVTIDADKKITVPEPTAEQLKTRYDNDKSQFMTPEYKSFNALVLSVDALKKQVTVTDDEIAQEYAATKDSYDTPEQRRVQQISFKDKAAAEAALKQLRDGSKTFADVAKEAGAKDTDVDLGLVVKASLIDPKIADAAFGLERDKYSDVVEGRFTTVILRVTQIEPGKHETLESVKEKVRDRLAEQKARDILQAKHDDIDDMRAAGKPLKDIADELKLPYHEVTAVDAKGAGKDGKPVIESPDLNKMVADVFAPDAGQFDQASELPSGAYAWITVTGSEAPKQKTFDEVKELVKTTYIALEHDRLLDALAKKLVERVNGGETLEAIAGDAGGKVEKSEPFTRMTVPTGLSQSAVAQAFALALGKAANAPSDDNTTRTIFKLTTITPAAAATPAQAATLRSELRDDYVNQELNEYAERLKRRYNATVNEAELQRALGVSEQ